MLPSDSNSTERPADFTGRWISRDGVNARTESDYVNGVPHGLHRSILENDVVCREGFKKNGLWHGTLITRKNDGTVLDTSEFVEGTGTYRIFTSSGKLVDEIPLLNGKRHGLVRCWRGGRLVETRYAFGVAE